MKRLVLLIGLLSCFSTMLWAQIESVSASGVLRKDPKNPTWVFLFKPSTPKGYMITSSKGHAGDVVACPRIGQLFDTFSIDQLFDTKWDDIRVTVIGSGRSYAFTSEVQGCTTDNQDMYFMMTTAVLESVPDAVLNKTVTMMLQEVK